MDIDIQNTTPTIRDSTAQNQIATLFLLLERLLARISWHTLPLDPSNASSVTNHISKRIHWPIIWFPHTKKSASSSAKLPDAIGLFTSNMIWRLTWEGITETSHINAMNADLGRQRQMDLELTKFRTVTHGHTHANTVGRHTNRRNIWIGIKKRVKVPKSQNSIAWRLVQTIPTREHPNLRIQKSQPK